MSGSSKKTCCCGKQQDPRCGNCVDCPEFLTVSVDNIRLQIGGVECDTGEISQLVRRNQAFPLACRWDLDDQAFGFNCNGTGVFVTIGETGGNFGIVCFVGGDPPGALVKVSISVRRSSGSRTLLNYVAPWFSECPPLDSPVLFNFLVPGSVAIVDPGTVTIME